MVYSLQHSVGNRARTCGSWHGVARQFIERTLRDSRNEFVVRYLHVDRKDELDSRKLYALWLKQRLEAEQMVELDYEDFRAIVDQVVEGGVSDTTTTEDTAGAKR